MIRNRFKSLLLELVGEAIDLGIDRAASALATAREAKSTPTTHTSAEPTPRKMPEGTRLSSVRCEHCHGPVFFHPVMGTRQRLIHFSCQDCGVFWTLPPFDAATREGIPL